jgi:hypothetical protein
MDNFPDGEFNVRLKLILVQAKKLQKDSRRLVQQIAQLGDEINNNSQSEEDIENG